MRSPCLSDIPTRTRHQPNSSSRSAPARVFPSVEVHPHLSEQWVGGLTERPDDGPETTPLDQGFASSRCVPWVFSPVEWPKEPGSGIKFATQKGVRNKVGETSRGLDMPSIPPLTCLRYPPRLAFDFTRSHTFSMT
jgi:hypothetical protein